METIVLAPTPTSHSHYFQFHYTSRSSEATTIQHPELGYNLHSLHPLTPLATLRKLLKLLFANKSVRFASFTNSNLQLLFSHSNELTKYWE